MKLEPIKVKVTIIGEDFAFSFKEDYTEYAGELIESKNVFLNTGEPMTPDNILNYFREEEFNDEDIDELNGSHFLYGFLEQLGQSEHCHDMLYAYDGKLKYKTELIKD